jgi:DNA-binding response OmpR family regulator
MLVIDDSTDVADFIADVAGTMGVAVEIATGWDAFRNLYARIDPLVIVLDLILPDADGVEILHYLGERAATASIVGQRRGPADHRFRATAGGIPQPPGCRCPPEASRSGIAA